MELAVNEHRKAAQHLRPYKAHFGSDLNIIQVQMKTENDAGQEKNNC